MIRHVVMFQWNETATEADVKALADGLDGLPSLIPEIVSYHHGPDEGLGSGNFDYVVVGDFNTTEDYVAYRDHPAHQELIKNLIAGKISERSAVQYAFKP